MQVLTDLICAARPPTRISLIEISFFATGGFGGVHAMRVHITPRTRYGTLDRDMECGVLIALKGFYEILSGSYLRQFRYLPLSVSHRGVSELLSGR